MENILPEEIRDILLRLISLDEDELKSIRKHPAKLAEFIRGIVNVLSQMGIKGLWEVFDWFPCSQHIRATQEHLMVDRHLGVFEHCGCHTKLAFVKENKIVDEWIDAIIAHMLGTDVANQDLNVDYIAIGSNYTTPAAGDSALGNELYRAAPTYEAQSSRSYVAELYVNPTTANGETDTVASVGTQFQVFDLTDATNFVAGDRIRLATSNGNEFATISTIVSNTITLTSATYTTGTITVGGTVIQCWGEYSTIAGGATGSPSANDLFVNRAQSTHAKTSGKGAVVRVTVAHVAA